VSACGQTAAFSVACSKLRPNGLCLDAEVLCFPLFEAVRQLGAAFSVPHRFADAADGGFRRPYPYALSAASARLSFRYPSFMAHHDWAR